MNTAIISGYGGLDKINYITTKQVVPKSDELLIEVKSFGLNPKDILVRKGKFKRFSGKKFPQKIGFEFAGIVITATKSKLIKPGDKVIGLFNGFKGQCSSQYICVKEKLIWKMPSQLSFEDASGVSLVGLTSLQAIRDLGKAKSDSTICINGASGGVGTTAIQIAKIFSRKVTAIASYRNIENCLSLGANEVIDYTKSNILKEKKSFDIFFDVFGNYSFRQVKHLLNPKGIYITTVPSKDIFIQTVKNLFRFKKAKLIIVKSKQKDLHWLVSQINDKHVKPVVDKIFSFDQIKQAQKYLETKRAKGKVIISLNDKIESDFTDDTD